MAMFRFHLLLGIALIAAAACANQPQRAADSPAGATSPPAIASTAPQASASDAESIQAMKNAVPPRLLVFAHDQGFTQVVMKGDNFYFCKTEDPMGSIIPTRQCINRSQLEALQVTVEQQREQLSRRAPESTGIH